MISNGPRRVTSRHCDEPDCWCASEVVVVYGHRDGGFLIEAGEDCWQVATRVLIEHTESTAPCRLDRLVGVDSV